MKQQSQTQPECLTAPCAELVLNNKYASSIMQGCQRLQQINLQTVLERRVAPTELALLGSTRLQVSVEHVLAVYKTCIGCRNSQVAALHCTAGAVSTRCNISADAPTCTLRTAL